MPSIINASTTPTSGLVQTADASGVLQLQSNGVTGLTVSTGGNVTVNTDLFVSGSQVEPLVLATVQTATGTAVDFTGIPSWVKRITVMFNAVSTNGTNSIATRLGTASGIDNTGYISGLAYPSGTASAVSSDSTGFYVSATDAAALVSGSGVLTHMGNNIWTWLCNTYRDTGTDGMSLCAGSVTLDGVLTTVRITTFSGVNTFDAGTVNIMYE